MKQFFASTPVINYVGAALWTAAPFLIALLVLGFLIRTSRVGSIIAGVLLILGSVPAAFMLELSINGCCGAPSTGYEGIGYAVGFVIALAGIGLVIFGGKLVKKKSAK